jgi:hypothetical protein
LGTAVYLRGASKVSGNKVTNTTPILMGPKTRESCHFLSYLKLTPMFDTVAAPLYQLG